MRRLTWLVATMTACGGATTTPIVSDGTEAGSTVDAANWQPVPAPVSAVVPDASVAEPEAAEPVAHELVEAVVVKGADDAMPKDVLAYVSDTDQKRLDGSPMRRPKLSWPPVGVPGLVLPAPSS